MSTAFHLSIPSEQERLPVLPVTAINLMPFRLEYDGAAPISTYFMPRTIPNPACAQAESSEAGASFSAQPSTIKIAAFRGRRVQAHELNLPDGYTGLLLQAPPIPLPSDVDVPSRSRAETPRPSRSVAELKQVDDAGPIGLRRSPRKRNIDAVTGPAKKGVDLAQMRKNARRKVETASKKSKFSLDSDAESDDEEDDEPKRPSVATQNHDTSRSTLPIPPKLEDKPTPGAASDVPSPDIPAAPDIKSPTPGADVPPVVLADAIQPGLASQPQSPLPDEPAADAEPEQTLDATVIRQLKATATFSGLTVWSPDGPLDLERDEYVRGLGEWMRLSQLVHGPLESPSAA